MSQLPLFSSGLELANLVLTSDLLYHSWNAILGLYSHSNPHEHPSLPFSIRYKAYQQQQPNCTIIAFVSTPTCTKQYLQGGGADLVPSATLKETFPLFEFLCTKGNPSFSIHKAAINLFASIHHELSALKNQFGNSSTPLIITGHSLGGSIASLFTLWLLENINPSTTKLPLCITFGSPLIGDNGLRQVILERSTWNSCFLHVASNQDPVPRHFISPHNPPTRDSASQTSVYQPFGTVFLCSESGSACFEDPESILELLVAMGSEGVRNQYLDEGLHIYGEIVEHLKRRVLCKGISELGERIARPLRAGIIVQLEAIGVKKPQQQQQNIDINTLITKMEKWEANFVTHKKAGFDPNKKLNDIKVNMAHLEWYKKASKDNRMGYYDSYKNMRSRSDMVVVKFKKKLTNYWKDMVAEAERKPQKQGVAFQTRWLYAGTNYRRMVEPLDIAEYYKERGLKDYLTQGRSEHYILLEQWQKSDERPAGNHNNASERNMACSLTEDSCFWAHVEEAIILCKLLTSRGSSPEDEESSRKNLVEFEHYVMDLISKYAVSPEIFLEQSSFMQWWREYEKIIEISYNSQLTDFMKNRRYQQYA